MHPLYVVQQNSKLRIRNQRLQVELDADGEAGPEEAEVLASLPLPQVSQVILFGNIGLTTPAIQTLITRDIEVVFLSEDGEYRGRLVGGMTPHVPLRRKQYERTSQADFCLGMAQGFVRAKLEHMQALLQRHNRELNSEKIEASIASLSQALAGLPQKTSLNALKGSEGAVSAAYFRGLRSLFKFDWGFEQRNRRPPRDPVNVLLSLGYTLLADIAFSAVQSVGMDPFAGFLHEYVYNRPALALDLMEEFRPVVDGIVLWALNGSQLGKEDFSPGPPERPVVLEEAGLKKFLQAFETRFDQKFTHPIRQLRYPLRQCIFEQARQIANRIQDGQPGYTDMGFR